MHEFRLPPTDYHQTTNNTSKLIHLNHAFQQAVTNQNYTLQYHYIIDSLSLSRSLVFLNYIYSQLALKFVINYIYILLTCNNCFQEVWTLCRILKRSTSPNKCLAATRDQTNVSKTNGDLVIDANSKTCSGGSENMHALNISFQQNPEPVVFPNNHILADLNHLVMGPLTSTMHQQAASTVITSYSNFSSPEMNEFVQYADWEQLRSFAEFGGCDQCRI